MAKQDESMSALASLKTSEGTCVQPTRRIVGFTVAASSKSDTAPASHPERHEYEHESPTSVMEAPSKGEGNTTSGGAHCRSDSVESVGKQHTPAKSFLAEELKQSDGKALISHSSQPAMCHQSEFPSLPRLKIQHSRRQSS